MSQRDGTASRLAAHSGWSLMAQAVARGFATVSELVTHASAEQADAQLRTIQ